MISYEYIDIKLVIILLLIIGLINDYYLVRFGRAFFVSGFSFTGTNNSQNNRGKKGNIFASPLPISPTYGHSYFYLQFSNWNEFLTFLFALKELPVCYLIYPPLETKIRFNNNCILFGIFYVKSCPSNFSQRRDCFEFTSIITPVFQAKCMTQRAILPCGGHLLEIYTNTKSSCKPRTITNLN